MSAIRDLLLPGFWAIMNSGPCRHFDLLDKDGDIVVILEAKEIGLLTADEIGDGSYKTKFAPRVQEIRDTGTWQRNAH